MGLKFADDNGFQQIVNVKVHRALLVDTKDALLHRIDQFIVGAGYSMGKSRANALHGIVDNRVELRTNSIFALFKVDSKQLKMRSKLTNKVVASFAFDGQLEASTTTAGSMWTNVLNETT